MEYFRQNTQLTITTSFGTILKSGFWYEAAKLQIAAWSCENTNSIICQSKSNCGYNRILEKTLLHIVSHTVAGGCRRLDLTIAPKDPALRIPPALSAASNKQTARKKAR